MPFAQLVRFSGLKPRTVRASVLALIQHNLVWHSERDDEGEVLEFNQQECLIRLRFGTFISLAKEILGEAVSLYGFLYLSEVIHMIECSIGSQNRIRYSTSWKTTTIRCTAILIYYRSKGHDLFSVDGEFSLTFFQRYLYIYKPWIDLWPVFIWNHPQDYHIYPEPIACFVWKLNYARNIRVYPRQRMSWAGK